MTFGQLVETHARSTNAAQPDVEAARAAVLGFLRWDGAYEERFAQDTRIMLASADFGKELTTAVMWLRDHDIDIRCIRLKPYKMADGTLLLDVQQLIPLPEIAEFQTQIGVKKQAERQSRSARLKDRLQFWEGLLALARTKIETHANRKPTQDSWISGGIGRTGFALNYVIRQTDSHVELWIALGAGQITRNKAVFRALESQKEADIEATFGGSLDWQPLPGSDGCRIRWPVAGGYISHHRNNGPPSMRNWSTGW